MSDIPLSTTAVLGRLPANRSAHEAGLAFGAAAVSRETTSGCGEASEPPRTGSMMMQGMPFDFPLFAGFIFMLGITMVAAPGVPGGAIMAALGILQSMLGFDESAQALMIALYIAMDSFGTACNVTGDGAIALIINKVMGKGTGK